LSNPEPELNEEPREATIRDSLQTLRRRKFVILGIMLVGALVAFGLSATQKKVYTAEATLQAQNLQENAGLANILQQNTQLPQQTSAQLIQTATRAAVMQEVKTDLGSPKTISQLRADLSFTQDPTSNLVLIQGQASNAKGAAALTNAAANAVAKVSNEDARRYFANIADSLDREANRLTAKFAGKKFGSLTLKQQQQVQNNAQRAKTLEDNAARLSTFSRVVNLAQVAETATPPGSPSSPRPIRNMIIGAVVGLFLGLLVTWFLESLDRRLRRPDEAETVLGLPVLGAIARGSLGKIPGTDDPAGLDAHRMVRTNVRFIAPDQDDPPRSILVTSPVPEEGKTTVALGLALSAAATGVRTLLIEADVHRPVHADRLGLNRTPGLADYLRGDAKPKDVLQVHTFVDPAVAATKNGSNGALPTATLSCITAGKHAARAAGEIGSERFVAMLEQVKEAYELVVIDSGPLLAVPETSEIVPAVDGVVFCVRLGRTTTEQAKAGRDALSRLPEKPAGLVITELGPDAGGYYGYGSYAYGYRAKTPA
jgi:Mrp family chromosome partitioning ATPase/LPS O-antigen subunit length determinant protein (WzzB/FepE family)